jgi:hypothetical protein
MRNIGNLATTNSTERFWRLGSSRSPGCSRRPSGRAFWLAVLLALPCGGGFSQQSPMVGPQFPTAPHGMPQDPNEPSPFYDQYPPGEAEKRLRTINAERQKSMVSDTEKLLKLATELNSEIAQSNPGALTPAQLRKVAEIEKLAHNVKDKMVMSVRGPQFQMDSPPPYFPTPH